MSRRKDIKKVLIIRSGPIIIGQACEPDDSYIRKNAIKYKIDYITTTAAALAATIGIKARRNGAYKVKSLQEYHTSIQYLIT